MAVFLCIAAGIFVPQGVICRENTLFKCRPFLLSGVISSGVPVVLKFLKF